MFFVKNKKNLKMPGRQVKRSIFEKIFFACCKALTILYLKSVYEIPSTTLDLAWDVL